MTLDSGMLLNYLCAKTLKRDKMNTGKEVSTKVVRVSPSVKKRLEVFQGGDTPNVVIDRMITFLK